jgi:hypothetical protein
VVLERTVQGNAGSANYPKLTRTNYAEWAIVMRVHLQAQHLLGVIEYGANDGHDDRSALVAVLLVLAVCNCRG